MAARCHGLIAADRNDQAGATDAFERALAEHELSAALATFDALGASRWADRARAELEWLDDQGLVLCAKNWWTSTHGFEEELISTLQRSSHAARQMLFDNLSDELGDDGKPHIELRAATLRDFGDDVHARIVNGAITHLLARSELFAALSQRVPSRAA